MLSSTKSDKDEEVEIVKGPENKLDSFVSRQLVHDLNHPLEISEKPSKVSSKNNRLSQHIDLLNNQSSLQIIGQNCLISFIFKPKGINFMILGLDPNKEIIKLETFLQYCKEQPNSPFYHLMSFDQSKKFFKNPENYKINFHQKTLVASWTIVAAGYEKKIDTKILLEEAQLDKVQKLHYQIYMLKKKLQKFQGAENQNKDKIILQEIDKQVIRSQKIKVEFKEDRTKKPKLETNKIIQGFKKTFEKEKQKEKERSDESVEQIKDKRRRIKRKQNTKMKDSFNTLKNDQPILIEQQKQVISEEEKKQTKSKRRGRKRKDEKQSCNSSSDLLSTKKQKKITRISKQSGRAFVGEKIRIEYDNGDFYFGDMKNNKYNGNGKYFKRQTGQTYYGNFKDGHAEGQGEIVDLQGNSYIGYFVKDLREGKGIDKYQNGQKYVGSFKRNFKDGFGTYNYINQDFYQGYWKDDKCHGKGKEVYANGSYFQGTWFQDQKDGIGILTVNGKKFKQLWDNGKLISSKPVNQKESQNQKVMKIEQKSQSSEFSEI